LFSQGVFQDRNVPTETQYLPTGDQPVPLYSSAAKDADDVLIRAYNNCPTLNTVISGWYSSPQFTAMSVATQSFRAHVGSLAGISTAALADLQYLGNNNAFDLRNWYNVWDQFNTWISTAGFAGNPMPDAGNMPMFTDSAIIPETGGLPNVPYAASRGPTLLGQITWLANWLETNKMNSDMVRGLAGGPILADLNSRISTAKAAQGQSGGSAAAAYSALSTAATYPRLVVISGHYNVQLGVLAALKVDKSFANRSAAAAAAAKWISVASLNVTGVIPSAAAVLAFELHRNSTGSGYAVRAVFQNGPGSSLAPTSYATMPLPCASDAGAATGGTGACTLEDFTALTASAVSSAGAPADWCSACGARTALPCAAARASSPAAGPPVPGMLALAFLTVAALMASERLGVGCGQGGTRT
jgi:hypothetical protein